jgi:hypothetical protein
MRIRSWRLLATGVIVSTAVVWAWVVPATAALRISYSGQSTSVKATVSSTTTSLADTGALASSGGALEASSTSGAVPDTLTSDTLHATTIGQGDRVRSESSVGRVALTAGLNSVSADLAMSRTMAVSQGERATVSGRSHVDGLIVNGIPVVVTGQPNQTLLVLDGQLVINEQINSGSGEAGSITVNALHLTMSGGTDVILGSSRAGVVAGSNNCSSTNDHTTGGGWFTLAGAKRTFGVIGGVRQNAPFEGHLVFVRHDTNDRLVGRITDYVPGTGNFREMDGEGEFNGQPQTFHLRLTDSNDDGTGDDFRLTFVAPPRQPEGDVIVGGNIQIHVPCH